MVFYRLTGYWKIRTSRCLFHEIIVVLDCKRTQSSPLFSNHNISNVYITCQSFLARNVMTHFCSIELAKGF